MQLIILLKLLLTGHERDHGTIGLEIIMPLPTTLGFIQPERHQVVARVRLIIYTTVVINIVMVQLQTPQPILVGLRPKVAHPIRILILEQVKH